ncbi:glycosyltransferase family 4 protein [Rodentibacter pneumotropicus]|uniref:glycosyltransferase family 4 protein n=1 Tax=Rodentibacter pneumotropicus TaxID=758 RepID=UPI000985AE9E|nr:glycosyltransferase family 4 protein [Rodentibacter pneumotropicus]OOF59114.1 glycosyltransferase WbuB [Rodentibacter pneumotropicus]THA16126.1 glycosyltransferase WbuB [Rodentibacter pneumotropicus]
MFPQKTIWIINQYASTPETGIGGRHYYLAEELSKLGYQVYVIAGSYSHLLRESQKLQDDFMIEEVAPRFSFVWVSLPAYHDAHSKQRIINEFIFSKKIKKLISVLLKPDVVYHSSPALISYFSARYISKVFKVPYVFEERDLWPLTLIELGGYSKYHPFICFLQWIEDRAYRQADFVFSNLLNAVEHLKMRGGRVRKFSWIPNGISITEMEEKENLSISIEQKIPKDKFIVGYTGTIGVANAIDDLIGAASLLQNLDIHFVLVGSGKEKLVLEQKCQILGLANITFIDALPKKQVQSMLERFHICYIGWHKNSLYRFGISPNKLPEYMYSGKPIIHAFSGSGDLVKKANAGLTVEAQNPNAIASAIKKLYDMKQEDRDTLGENGKMFVLHNLTYQQIALKLVDVLFN